MADGWIQLIKSLQTPGKLNLSQVHGHMPAFLGLGDSRQEDLKFERNLDKLERSCLEIKNKIKQKETSDGSYYEGQSSVLSSKQKQAK